MNIVNLTKQPINIMGCEGTAVIPPSGIVVHIQSDAVYTGEVDVDGTKVPVFKTTPVTVRGMPAPQEGTIYVVPFKVLRELPERSDLYAPYQMVRDGSDHIIGYRALARM